MSKLTSKLVIMFSAVILSYAVILVYNFSHFTADVLNTHRGYHFPRCGKRGGNL